MQQSWIDLLFAHWPVERALLLDRVPAPLELDTFDGTAWIAVAPFRIRGLRTRGLPPVPGTGTFLELNLRTYVRLRDRPGILFFTLEASSALAVAGARALYRLPYRLARMDLRHGPDGWIRYRSRRVIGEARFDGRYRPTGPARFPEPGTLEHFLTERYALYATLPRGRVLCGEIHHPPWPLQVAEAEIDGNTVSAAHGLPLTDPPALLHFAARQDTLVWAPERIR